MTDRTAPLDAELIVCRCELIDRAHVLAAIDAGALTVNDVKRQTKAGMGVCQGIYCVCEIVKLIAEQTGIDPADIPILTARPPVRPMSLARIADAGE